MPIAYDVGREPESPAQDRRAAEGVYQFPVTHSQDKITKREFKSTLYREGQFQTEIIILRYAMTAKTRSQAKIEVGRRLRAARYAVGRRNLAELANELEILPQTWTNYESGLHLPDHFVFGRFRELYKISDDYVRYGDKSSLPYALGKAVEAAEAEVAAEYDGTQKRGRGRPRLSASGTKHK